MSLIPSFFGRRSNVFHPFSLDIWDPFEGFPFTFSTLSPSEPRSSYGGEASAPVNTLIYWKETPEAHVFKADPPGPQERGGDGGDRGEDGDHRNRVERSQGKFLHRFRLRDNAKVVQVRAAMENGVLTVTVPKEEVKKPEVKSYRDLRLSSFCGLRL